MKALTLLALVIACERDQPSHVQPQPPQPPEPPQSADSDPIIQAHAEFELLPADQGVATHKLFGRGDFMNDDFSAAAMDEGDFLGRARTLFGAHDEFVIRHKKTGYLVTIYAGNSGPSYGGGPRYVGALPTDPASMMKEGFEDRRDRSALFSADPMLSKGMPKVRPGMSPQEVEAYRSQYHQYVRRMNDVLAGPELAAVVARLDALMNAVKPADWERTYYYGDEPGVYHVGVRGYQSFTEELEPVVAMTWLLDAAEQRVASAGNDLGPFSPDANALSYYKTHAGKLAAFRPRLQAALRRFETAARHHDGTLRESLLKEANELRAALR